MTTVKQALESAIEAMESCDVNNGYNGENQFYDERLIQTSLEQCKSALAELDKCEPVGYANKNDIKFNVNYIILKKKSNDLYDVAVYTAPQPREWIGLSDEAILEMCPYIDHDLLEEALEIGAETFGNDSIYQKPLEACKAALSDAVTLPDGWRPIKSAPKGEAVLVAGGDCDYPCTANYSGHPDECWMVDGQMDVYAEIGWPEYWMPLSALPSIPAAPTLNEKG